MPSRRTKQIHNSHTNQTKEVRRVDPQTQELVKVLYFLANYDIGEKECVITPKALNRALESHKFRTSLWSVIAEFETIFEGSTPAAMLERSINEAVKGTARSKTAAAGIERNCARADAVPIILGARFLAWVTPPLIEHYRDMLAGGRLQMSSNCDDSERRSEDED